MFHVRRRPADQQARRRKKKLSGSSGGAANSSSSSTINRSNHPDGGMNQSDDDRSMLPFLLELNPDGSEVRQGGVGVVRRHVLPPTVTEVGSERPHPAATSPVAGTSCLFRRMSWMFRLLGDEWQRLFDKSMALQMPPGT